MRFLATRPAPPLDALIDVFWQAEAAPGEAPEGAQFPEGGVCVLFNLGAPQGLRDAGSERTEWFDGAWVSGEQERALHLLAPRGSSLVGIRFRPGAARALFGLPMSELAGRVQDLTPFWPEAEELRERLAEAPPERRAEVLSRALLARLERRSHAVPRLVGGAVTHLAAAGPGASIGALAGALGVTPRHLRRVFAEEVGVGPKSLHRVLRSQRVVRALASTAPPPLAELALDCGYFDQAHLARDFRDFTGAPPRSFAAGLSPDPNYAPASDGG